MTEALKERIRKNVAINERGCWIWTAGLFTGGYPCIKVAGKSRKGNRVAYEVFKGPITDGMHVCHSCDDKTCVNPEHLWLGTQKENMQDAVKKGRNCSGAAHHSSKLTANQANAIRCDPRRQVDIAAEYSISQHMVSKIKRGESWKPNCAVLSVFV